MFSVSNIEYDLELQFLKTEEEIAMEKRACELKNLNQTPTSKSEIPSMGNHTLFSDSGFVRPNVDRSVKPAILNNTNNIKMDIVVPKINNSSKGRIETIHNNLNKPQSANLENLNSTPTNELSVKDTNSNMTAKAVSDKSQPVPDRSLKPKHNVDPQPLTPKVENKDRLTEANESTDTVEQNGSAVKLSELHAQIAEKEKEVEEKQKENHRLTLEHQV